MMNVARFADASKARIDVLFDLTGQALQGMEQLSTLNVQLVKTTLAEGVDGAKAALSARGVAELVTLQTATLKEVPQKAAAYGRHVQQIVTPLVAAQRAAVEAQAAAAQATLLDAVTGTLKNLPGSEKALALVKSTADAANNAYQRVSNASRQVSEAVAANVARISQVSQSPAGSAQEAVAA